MMEPEAVKGTLLPLLARLGWSRTGGIASPMGDPDDAVFETREGVSPRASIGTASESLGIVRVR